MQIFKPLRSIEAEPVSPSSAVWGLRVLFASDEGAGGRVARQMAALGGRVVVCADLARLAEHVPRADVLMVDCDGFGGPAAVGAVCSSLARQRWIERSQILPLVLISGSCREQSFPLRRVAPVQLRSPVSTVALHLAFEALFQGRSGPLTKRWA